MSVHNPEGLVLMAAAMEAIYQIAKPRVLDRYPDIEPLDDGYNTLHAWHFERPEGIQEEIYEECHVVAKEIGSFFDTEAFKAFDRLGRMRNKYLSNKLLEKSFTLRFLVEKDNVVRNFFTGSRCRIVAKTAKKGGE